MQRCLSTKSLRGKRKSLQSFIEAVRITVCEAPVLMVYREGVGVGGSISRGEIGNGGGEEIGRASEDRS